jgi:hypothetical protein
MEDEDTMTDFDPGEAAGMLKQLTQQYTGLQGKSAAARTALQQSRAERLRQAEETIRAARFGAPSRAEQMFAMSRAFLSPKPYRGIAGTLSNIVPVLGDAATAQRTAEERRSEALAKLQQGYADNSAELDLDALETERKGYADLMRVYGPLAKAPKRRTGFSPTTGRLHDMDTGTEIAPPPSGAVEALVAYMADPNNTPEAKRITAKNFERKFNVPASEYLQGGM